MPARHVVVLGVPDGQSLDISGPTEVFAGAALLRPSDPYRVELVAPGPGPFRTSSGLRLLPERALAAVEDGVDTFVVTGGPGARAACRDGALIAEVRRVAAGARRVASVCTGAFLLAEAGLLDGRRATTHWASADLLATSYPGVDVEPDRIFTRDGAVWTSAGVTAGIDLALELVAEDHGRDVAAQIARWLVVFVQRPGGQTQFSSALAAAPAASDTLRQLQVWMVEHPEGDLSVAALAERCGLSPRTFQRAVRRETGTTAGDLVERVRVEAARRTLEASDLPMAEVARRCGFRTVSTLYRAFERRVGVPPATYRRHFHKEAS
jgi:transcriptional regulator GlxA family with amidase domain